METTDFTAKCNFAFQFISEIFKLNLSLIRNTEDAALFSSRFRLHEQQIQLSQQAITEILHSARHEIIYPLNDIFQLHLCVFFLHDQLVILGPYSTLLLSQADVIHIFSQTGITGISPEQFLSYYNSFPNLPEKQVKQIIHSLILFLDPASQNRSYYTLSEFSTTTEKSSVLQEQYIRRIEERYIKEREFYLAVKNGNVQTALSNLHSMHQDVSYLKRIGTTLENERIGSAITRTTVRMAAEEAGLPPIIIDQISSDNTRKIRHAKTADEILDLKDTLVREFCKAIREHQKQKKSALSQSVAYYLRHNYTEPIRLDSISSELGVSSTYLGRIFKADYGLSPMEYLKNYRIEQAERLLVRTQHPIQEISRMVGIYDPNYFVKIFKSVNGMTPSAYRSQRTC